jgi:predicted RNA-binding protein Jag
MTKNKEQIIKETADKLFQLLGVTAEVAVEINDESANVSLTTEDTGMLIGYHGETLEALQLH